MTTTTKAPKAPQATFAGQTGATTPATARTAPSPSAKSGAGAAMKTDRQVDKFDDAPKKRRTKVAPEIPMSKSITLKGHDFISVNGKEVRIDAHAQRLLEQATKDIKEKIEYAVQRLQEQAPHLKKFAPEWGLLDAVERHLGDLDGKMYELVISRKALPKDQDGQIAVLKTIESTLSRFSISVISGPQAHQFYPSDPSKWDKVTLWVSKRPSTREPYSGRGAFYFGGQLVQPWR